MWYYLVFVLVMVALATGEQPKVVTPKGVFYGTEHLTARQQRRVFAFTKIPYAKPPTGDLRFRPPVPYGAHDAPFNATEETPPCLQWDTLRGRGPVGDEDCLYLNVFTNLIPEPPAYFNTQPVVVFLHAGTWMSGSGADGLFQPDFLLEHDVVVITVNHRLGPFGFLSTEDSEAPGNYGLMDQVAALEWVRELSRYFGGMNETVTVIGSGAGGISAHLLVLSPWARGATTDDDNNALLKNAISQSGTAYSPQALVHNPRRTAIRLGQHLGCTVPESHSLVNCLRALPAKRIVDAIPSLFVWDEEPVPFGPVVDEWQGERAVIPDQPHHLIRKKKYLRVPWIVGNNRNDGAFRVQDILSDPSLTQQLNQHWDKYGPVLLELKETSGKDPIQLAKKIKEFYMGNKPFSEDTAHQFVEMMTDRFFLYPAQQASEDHCYYLRGKYCYRYLLTFIGQNSFFDIKAKDTPNASALLGVNNPRFQKQRGAHGWGVSFLDELLYLFPSNKLDFIYRQSFNRDTSSRVSSHMCLLWSNFAKGGDPTPQMDGWPDDVSPWGAWWEPYMRPYYYYLQVDPEMETTEGPIRPDAMDFWKNLPLYENRDHNVLRDEL